MLGWIDIFKELYIKVKVKLFAVEFHDYSNLFED